MRPGRIPFTISTAYFLAFGSFIGLGFVVTDNPLPVANCHQPRHRAGGAVVRARSTAGPGIGAGAIGDLHGDLVDLLEGQRRLSFLAVEVLGFQGVQKPEIRGRWYRPLRCLPGITLGSFCFNPSVNLQFDVGAEATRVAIVQLDVLGKFSLSFEAAKMLA